MKFKDIDSGPFRTGSGVVYVKLRAPYKTENEAEINAIAISSGKADTFKDDEEVAEW